MNYLKLLKEIDELVDTDFCAEMETVSIIRKTNFTQAEAKQMAKLLAEVYRISHCIHCKACAKKYDNSNQV